MAVKHILEAQFQQELVASIRRAFGDLAHVSIGATLAGEPDLTISFWHKGTHARAEVMRVECKYVERPPRNLESVWNLLRGVQNVTMTNMAKAGQNVYVAVCVDGREILWYRFNRVQCEKVAQGKMPDWTVLAIERVSPRWSRGLWQSGRDYGSGVSSKHDEDYGIDLKKG